MALAFAPAAVLRLAEVRQSLRTVRSSACNAVSESMLLLQSAPLVGMR